MYHVEVVSLLYRFGCGIISKLACHPYNGPRRTVPDHLHATLATSDIAMKRAQKRARADAGLTMQQRPIACCVPVEQSATRSPTSRRKPSGCCSGVLLLLHLLLLLLFLPLLYVIRLVVLYDGQVGAP